MPDDLNRGRRRIDGRSVRWDEARARSAYERGLWIRRTLADALHEASELTPQRVLLVDGTARIDCATLHAQAATLQQAMLSRAPPGSVVSFMLPNWHEAAVLYLAATLAGMVVNPILPSLRDRELEFILKDVQSRMLFVPSTFREFDYAAMAGRVAGRIDAAPEVVVLRGEAGAHTSWDSLFGQARAAEALPTLEADAVRMVLYTSGTTGRPKGVLHSHNSIHALILQLREHWLIERGDKFLVPSPIAHIGGSIYAFQIARGDSNA